MSFCEVDVEWGWYGIVCDGDGMRIVWSRGVVRIVWSGGWWCEDCVEWGLM